MWKMRCIESRRLFRKIRKRKGIRGDIMEKIRK
jgi:hypothetical protein